MELTSSKSVVLVRGYNVVDCFMVRSRVWLVGRVFKDELADESRFDDLCWRVVPLPVDIDLWLTLYVDDNDDDASDVLEEELDSPKGDEGWWEWTGDDLFFKAMINCLPGFCSSFLLALVDEDLRGALVLPLDDLWLRAKVEDDDPGDPGLLGLLGDDVLEGMWDGRWDLEGESALALPVLLFLVMVVEDLTLFNGELCLDVVGFVLILLNFLVEASSISWNNSASRFLISWSGCNWCLTLFPFASIMLDNSSSSRTPV